VEDLHIQLYPAGDFPARYMTEMEHHGRRLLAEEVETLRELGAGDVKEYLRRGRPPDTILALASELDVDLLILGSRGKGAIERLLMGSVSETVVRHATCPVLVMRGDDESWPPRRVVLGDDGSQAARRAGDLAAGIGRAVGSHTILVRAFPEFPKPIRMGYPTPGCSPTPRRSCAKGRGSWRRRWEAGPASNSPPRSRRAR
jgi:hypothetical protein